MASQNLERALQDVKVLDVDEREQLLAALLASRRAPLPSTPADKAEAALLAKGIISRITPTPTASDIARHRSITPVKVGGKPVSESLVEDRR